MTAGKKGKKTVSRSDVETISSRVIAIHGYSGMGSWSCSRRSIIEGSRELGKTRVNTGLLIGRHTEGQPGVWSDSCYTSRNKNNAPQESVHVCMSIPSQMQWSLWDQQVINGRNKTVVMSHLHQSLLIDGGSKLKLCYLPLWNLKQIGDDRIRCRADWIIGLRRDAGIEFY